MSSENEVLRCPVTVAIDDRGGAAGFLELRATKHGWPDKFFLLNNHQGIISWGANESAVGAGANTSGPGPAIDGAVRVKQTRGGNADAQVMVVEAEGGAVESLSGYAILKLKGSLPPSSSYRQCTPTPLTRSRSLVKLRGGIAGHR